MIESVVGDTGTTTRWRIQDAESEWGGDRRGKRVIGEETRVSGCSLKGTLLLSIPADEDRATLRRLNAEQQARTQR